MRSAKENVFENLKEKIISGELAPGRWLTEREICEMYGISRTPVREIMWKLANIYLVEISKEHGYQVKQFSLNEVIEIYNARQAVEGTCARLACSSTKYGYEETLRSIKEELLAVDADRDPIMGDIVGHKVHAFVIEHANNKYLQDFNEKFNSLSAFMRNIIRKNKAIETKAKGEHQKIIDALEIRDGAAAEASMIEHIRNTCRDTINNYL